MQKFANVCSNGDTSNLWYREQIQWCFPETQPAPAWLPRGEAPAEQGQAALTPLRGALSVEHMLRPDPGTAAVPALRLTTCSLLSPRELFPTSAP